MSVNLSLDEVRLHLQQMGEVLEEIDKNEERSREIQEEIDKNDRRNREIQEQIDKYKAERARLRIKLYKIKVRQAFGAFADVVKEVREWLRGLCKVDALQSLTVTAQSRPNQ